jgi:Holliday junction resolvase RusA-like endonuclease
MPKPVNAPKRRRTYPAVSPDIDKLERSTYDAISTAKAWEDDGRVIESHSRKVYPGEHPDALPEPGAIIRLYTLPGATS